VLGDRDGFRWACFTIGRHSYVKVRIQGGVAGSIRVGAVGNPAGVEKNSEPAIDVDLLAAQIQLTVIVGIVALIVQKHDNVAVRVDAFEHPVVLGIALDSKDMIIVRSPHAHGLGIPKVGFEYFCLCHQIGGIGAGLADNDRADDHEDHKHDNDFDQGESMCGFAGKGHCYFAVSNLGLRHAYAVCCCKLILDATTETRIAQ